MWDVTIYGSDVPVIPISFLLTHPVWDVTPYHMHQVKYFVISTHTSRVGCDSSLPIVPMFGNISTHTSRVGCDAGRSFRRLLLKISTHTSRVGCDQFKRNRISNEKISTHTSRVGCDTLANTNVRGLGDFYSHIPCGMWRKCTEQYSGSRKEISTHTSRVGCDRYI